MATHGARIGGRWCSTKKALRQALAADPASVWFEATADSTSVRGDRLPVGQRLIVVGPDPMRNRLWHANVALKPNGTFTVR